MNSHNPYTPPEARVADQEIAAAAFIPRQVVWVTWLQWSTIAVGCITSLFNGTLPALMRSGGYVAVIFSLGFVLLFTMWINAKLRAGRNWMRILLLIVIVTGIGMQILRPFPGSDPLASRISIFFNDGVQIVALWLLFTRPGADGFRRNLAN